ncbi:MAG: group III truncated hemoglobin [Cryomorphaceae bacterium]|nr:group III truncated hemoglobin [Cryomorphaceae bacterium]
MPAGSNEKRDITTIQDLEFLIRKFYDKLLVDEQIGHFFIKLNLEEHIPKVASFWAFIALDSPGYKGNMMEAHAKLELKTADFERWLNLFHQTIHEYFTGETADFIVQRSSLIAWTMQSKL